MAKAKNIELEPAENTGTAPVKLVENTEAAPVESTKSTDETAQIPAETSKHLDADEEEFKKLRRDLPGMKGVSATGIVTLSVGKAPRKNEYFRTHPTFCPIVALVNHEVGMDKHYFAVTDEMVVALEGIGITVSYYMLYLTITSGGALRVIPVRQAGDDGEQNEWDRTKEIGLLAGMTKWKRFYTDKANSAYRVYPAPEGRFDEPKFPDLPHAKIFRLAFRDKGHLIDSPEHPLFKKWAARDNDKE
jgi:hypothetical protein